MAANSDEAHSGDGNGDRQFTFRYPSTGSTISNSIEADPVLSGIYDDTSASLSESVQTYPKQFGRTYHAYRAGSYPFPNDLPECERLQLQYDIVDASFNGNLFFAPLDKPRYILDVATGTGDWAVQMGDLFPQANVVATDLSPIQPVEVPPNVEFYVEDSSEEWEYSHKFDYIHTRLTGGSWSSYERQVLRQAFDNLNPGGWMESQEGDASFSCDDGSLKPGHALYRWGEDLALSSRIIDRPMVFVSGIKDMYASVGFVDIHEKIFKIPCGTWPKDERLKELGRGWQLNVQSGLSGFTFANFYRAFGVKEDAIEVYLVDVRKDIANSKIHAYTAVHVVWGRKPFPGEVSES